MTDIDDTYAPIDDAYVESIGPLPAHDEAAEQSVLGGMIASSKAIVETLDIIKSNDFYFPKHQAIYDAIVAVNDAGNAVDVVTLAQHLAARLGDRGELDRIGGVPYLHTLYSISQPVSSTIYHARIVATKAAQRRLGEAGMRLQDLAHRAIEVEDLQGFLEKARGIVDVATAEYQRRGAEEGIWIGELAAQSLERYAMPRPPAIPTGWADLDELLDGGLRPGTLTVLGARPAVGKSLVGVQMGVELAVKTITDLSAGVLIASLEMPRTEVADRVLSQLAKIPLQNLTRHELSQSDWEKLRYWTAKLHDVPLRVEDTPHMTMAKLRGLARDMTRHPAGCGMVVADYVQLLQPADRTSSRQEQVAQFSRDLKLLAKELHCPVVALAQLNRDVEKRHTPRPVLSDLRESGAIEQDADNIMLLWDDPDKLGERQIVLAKHRQGRTGDVRLAWRPWIARADDLSHVQD